MNQELDLASRKAQLNTQLDALTGIEVLNASNYKFMNLLRSRLTEEDIPLDIASMIVAHQSYDMSAVNEDDDYLGEVAVRYAEFCGDVYRKLEASNWHRNITPVVVQKYFVAFPITL